MVKSTFSTEEQGNQHCHISDQNSSQSNANKIFSNLPSNITQDIKIEVETTSLPEFIEGLYF